MLISQFFLNFRINGQYVSQTGYLGEELNVDNQYLNLVTEETMEEDPNHVSFIPDVEPAQDGNEEAPMLDDHSLVAANDDIDNGEGRVGRGNFWLRFSLHCYCFKLNL